MRRSISMLLAAAMAISGAATGFVPAQAAMPAVPPTVSSGGNEVIPVQDIEGKVWYYPGSPAWRSRHGGGWDGRRGWRGGRGWDNDDWRWRDRRHGRRGRDRHDDDHGAALALGLFGFATGALLGSQLHGGYGGGYGGGQCGAYDRHDAACDRRFRSYDWCSNTYLGYDGDRHYC